MKQFITLFSFVLISFQKQLSGQDTVMFNSEYNLTSFRETTNYYCLLDANEINKPIKDVKFYDYENHRLKAIADISRLGKGMFHGYYKSFDTAGNITSYGKYVFGDKDSLWTYYDYRGLKSTANYSLGNQHGDLTYYFPNGKVRRIITFVNNVFMEGKCWDEDGKEVEYYPPVKRPEFNGGREAFKKYLQENIIYPKAALNKNKEGVVPVEFVVDTDGSISNVRALKNLGYGLTDVAIDVIKNSPKWIPGEAEGVPVKSYMIQEITFKLKD